MYWLKYIFFLVVALVATSWWASTAGMRIGDSWSGVPLDTFSLYVKCITLAVMTRFADAGSTSIALSKPGLIEGAPGLGRFPSRGSLYRLAFRQSLLIVLATVGIGLRYPQIAILALIVISATSGMAVVNNQVLYWLAPTAKSDPDFVDALIHNSLSTLVQISALITSPAAVILLACDMVGLRPNAEGLIAKLFLPVPRESLLGVAGIWAMYLCLGTFGWDDIATWRTAARARRRLSEQELKRAAVSREANDAYVRGMNLWHARQRKGKSNRQKAKRWIQLAARGGHPEAEMMARMHGIKY